VKRVLLVVGFLPTTILTLTLSLFLLIKLPNVNEVDSLLRQQARMIKNPPSDYQVAAFIPQVLGSFTEAITSGDARPIIIRNYLEQYKSPMAPHAELFVKKADQYGLDNYLLPIAIAQQESNLGKKTPPNCHNAWGWGIHSRGTLCFKDWPTGIDAYIKGLTARYDDILQIEEEDEMLQKLMARYAPVSLANAGGSWAKGVKQFLNEMR
jgi:hypothetical protein